MLHFFHYGLFPKVGSGLFVYFQCALHCLGYFYPKFKSAFVIATIQGPNDTLMTFQDKGHPPSKSLFLYYFVDDSIFGDLNRVGFPAYSATWIGLDSLRLLKGSQDEEPSFQTTLSCQPWAVLRNCLLDPWCIRLSSIAIAVPSFL